LLPITIIIVTNLSQYLEIKKICHIFVNHNTNATIKY